MYAAAITLSAATTVGTTGIPYFHLGSIGPIQWFGLIVAAGVLIGASILRRYAEWHGVSDDNIRGLTGWITVTGFLGAHLLDVFMYQDKSWLQMEPVNLRLFTVEVPLILRLWEGISSYGGFVGGALGFFFFVWWKRLPPRLMADIAIVGLLPAFSIGRIGCTVVSDHIGAYVDPSSAFAFLAQNYPRNSNMEVVRELVAAHPGTSETILAWNLGLIEFLYLVPINILILWLAFRRKRSNAGFITVLTGVLYAPVRFFLDYLRPESSDARHFGLTFAQWASLLAFGGAVYVAMRVFKNGAPAETIAPTAKEAQELLSVNLKEAATKVEPKKETPKAKADLPKATASEKSADKATDAKPDAAPKEDPYAEAKRLKEEADEAAAIERRRKQDEAMAAKEAAEKKAAVADKSEKAGKSDKAEK
ncbi:MAG: prolipoprotein diacylglyceryl transferase [Kofleriaceae bacterium]|nr:prolipoprotein diacylglyceryl transferase [Kofleriaceae bacterium]